MRAARTHPVASGMDLTQLRYFQGIARAGNMTHAARTLHVSQPTVSLAVKHLEASLGTTLFMRHRSGVSLTASGEELLRHVDEVMNMLDRAAERISSLDHRLTGNFSIGCHESLGAYFLPRFLEQVLENAPEVNVSLHNDASASVLDAVVRRELHFGIVVNPRPHPDVVLTDLFRDAIDVFGAAPNGKAGPGDPDALYGPPGSRFSDLDQARAHFERHPLIFPSRVEGCGVLLERLAEHGFKPARRIECGDFGLVKSLAASGIGPALLPRRIAAHDTLRPLRRLHYDLPMFEDRVQLVYRADMPRTRAATYLKEELIRSGHAMGSVGL